MNTYEIIATALTVITGLLSIASAILASKTIKKREAEKREAEKLEAEKRKAEKLYTLLQSKDMAEESGTANNNHLEDFGRFKSASQAELTQQEIIQLLERLNYLETFNTPPFKVVSKKGYDKAALGIKHSYASYMRSILKKHGKGQYHVKNQKAE